MSAPPPKVLLAVITDGKPDMNLQCCISILHTQIDLMTAAKENAFMAELLFFEKINDALDKLHKDKDCKGAFIIRHNSYVPGVFAVKAFGSGEKIVISPSPRASVDWGRVKDKCLTADEVTSHIGNTYNAKLKGLPNKNGYALAKDTDWIDAMFVRREVVDDIAAKHPEIVSPEKSAFALDGVYDGRFVNGPKRFFEMYGGPVLADVENQTKVSGPLEYVGCVGSRKILR
jgi:hypothetical protein